MSNIVLCKKMAKRSCVDVWNKKVYHNPVIDVGCFFVWLENLHLFYKNLDIAVGCECLWSISFSQENKEIDYYSSVKIPVWCYVITD